MFNFFLLYIFMITGTAVSDGDVLELTDEQYYQLPDLFEMENYEKCLSQRGNAFCAGIFELMAHAPSTLYDLLKKFSENQQENFNHTRIHRAVCLGPKSSCPINGEMADSFEGCVNRRTHEAYGLNAKLMKLHFCRREGEKLKMDRVDKAFIVFFIAIVVANLVGTAYHVFVKDDHSKGNRWLMAFSLLDNWTRLTSESGGGDSRFQNLTVFNGTKAIAMSLVHGAHVLLMAILCFVANPRFVEQIARRPDAILFRNSDVIIQSFVFIANFLLAYKLLVSSEKYRLNISILPKIIIERLIRIYPMQLVSIGIVATVAVHLNDGPFWYQYVVKEAEHCRDTWWHHVLFIHNFYAPKCIPQSWCLAVDFQLYIVSSIIMLWIISRGLDPELVLWRLLAGSMLGVFGLIYALELEPAIKHNTPENLLSVYAEDRSFRWLYQSSWGSLPTAIIGLLVASIYYRLEREKVDLAKNKTFVAIVQSMAVMVWMWCFSSYFFFLNVKSRFAVSLYATISKPGFAVLYSLIVLGCLYKIKGPAMTILCWPGWLVLSRLSLGSLMMHIAVNKFIVGSRMWPSTMSFTHAITDTLAVNVITYLVVFPITLLVQYPVVQLYKAILYKDPADETKKTKHILNDIKNNNRVEINDCSNGKNKKL